LEPVLNGTGKQQLYETFIAWLILSFQEIFSAIDAFNLEFLA